MNSKPRLLVLASTYPRWNGDFEPGFVHELSRRLTAEFDVTVVCPAAPGVPAREEMDGVRIRRFRYAPDRMQTLVNDGGIVTNLKHALWKWTLVPFFVLAEAWCVWKSIRNDRPNAVHAHWLLPQGLVISVLSLISSKAPPYLVTSHGADLFALRAWPMSLLKRFVIQRAAAITVVSQAMVKELEQLGAGTQKVSVQSMGVDLRSKFVPDPMVKRSEHEILFVGRLVEKKGLRYLLEAMPAIVESQPAAHLTIVGFGPEEKRLRQEATSLGLEGKVRFLGAVPQEKLPQLYRRAAVFVAPFVQAGSGDREGLGLVTIEAIGCGCPVIVSDLPSVRDVVADENRRSRVADSADLANKISQLLAAPAVEKESVDSELRRRAIQRFDWSHVAAGYADTLRGVADCDQRKRD